MNKNRFSMASLMLITAILLAGISMYLNYQKRNRPNDIKSQLTETSPKEKQSPFKAMLQQRLNKIESNQTPSPTEDNSGATLLTKERIYTEEELQNMSQEQFSEMLKDIEMRLPKLSDIKSIPPGALHRTPPLVIEAGRNLGAIKEVLKIHDSYEKMALPFYQNCAKNDQGSTPVRALCLTNLIEIYKKNNKSLNLKEYPSQLLELSKLITDI